MTTAYARKAWVDALTDEQRLALNEAMPVGLGKPALLVEDGVAWLVYSDARADVGEVRSALDALGVSEGNVRVA